MKKILHLLLLTAFLLLSLPGCQYRNPSDLVIGPDTTGVQPDTIETRLLINDCTKVIEPMDGRIGPHQVVTDKPGSDSIKRLKKTNSKIIPDPNEKEKSRRDGNRRLKRINPENMEKDKPGIDSIKGFFGFTSGKTGHSSGSR